MQINLVKQKHACGCTIACLAMVTGYDYDNLIKYFYGRNGRVIGLFPEEIKAYLDKRGYSCSIVKRSLNKQEVVIRPVFSPNRVFLYMVIPYSDSGVSHMIVEDQYGILYDPECGITSWKDYYSIVGIIKVEASNKN